MAKVRKGNVNLHIDDADITRYLRMGYDHITEDGKVITAAEPTDFDSYRRAYNNQLTEIAKLKAEVERLNEMVAKASTSATKRSKKSATAEE